MKKTFKLSVPYLGKAVVVTVVSFSCAISAYQLYQNSSIFSPQSQALDLKNNQVVFSKQNQQTNTNQKQDESQYLNENQQALDKISQTNFNNSPYLFKNQGRVDPTKIYGIVPSLQWQEINLSGTKEFDFTTNELIKLLGQSLNRKSRIWKIKKSLIESLSKSGDFLNLPINSERLQKLTENYTVSNKKITNAIGKSLPISSKEGLLSTFESFK